jgi:hypothetical protein
MGSDFELLSSAEQQELLVLVQKATLRRLICDMHHCGRQVSMDLDQTDLVMNGFTEKRLLVPILFLPLACA